MIDEIQRFVGENFAFVVIGAVILLIIGDEVLGVSRALLGDETDDLPATPKARKRAEEAEAEILDPPERRPEEGEPTVDDFLPPPPEK